MIKSLVGFSLLAGLGNSPVDVSSFPSNFFGVQTSQVKQSEPSTLVAGGEAIDSEQEAAGVGSIEPDKRKAEEKKELKSEELVSSKYKESKTIKSKIRKVVVYSLMGQTKNFDGVLQLKGKSLRLDLDGDAKSQILIHGGKVWITNFSPPDSGLKTQVTEANLDESGKAHALLTSLLGGDIKSEFEITKSEDLDSQKRLILKPKKEFEEFKTVRLLLNSSDRVIKSISHDDNLDNQTTYEFKDTEFGVKIDDSVFSFQLPKDAEVTKL